MSILKEYLEKQTLIVIERLTGELNLSKEELVELNTRLKVYAEIKEVCENRGRY